MTNRHKRQRRLPLAFPETSNSEAHLEVGLWNGWWRRNLSLGAYAENYGAVTGFLKLYRKKRLKRCQGHKRYGKSMPVNQQGYTTTFVHKEILSPPVFRRISVIKELDPLCEHPRLGRRLGGAS